MVLGAPGNGARAKLKGQTDRARMQGRVRACQGLRPGQTSRGHRDRLGLNDSSAQHEVFKCLGRTAPVRPADQPQYRVLLSKCAGRVWEAADPPSGGGAGTLVVQVPGVAK
jgi:hypothetical protein